MSRWYIQFQFSFPSLVLENTDSVGGVFFWGNGSRTTIGFKASSSTTPPCLLGARCVSGCVGQTKWLTFRSDASLDNVSSVIDTYRHSETAKLRRVLLLHSTYISSVSPRLSNVVSSSTSSSNTILTTLGYNSFLSQLLGIHVNGLLALGTSPRSGSRRARHCRKSLKTLVSSSSRATGASRNVLSGVDIPCACPLPGMSEMEGEEGI